MKFKIDTKEKIITIDGNVNIGELIKRIKSMFPDDWEDYTIETSTTIEYVYPYPYQPVLPVYQEPYRPSTDPFNPYIVTCELTKS